MQAQAKVGSYRRDRLGAEKFLNGRGEARPDIVSV